ATKKPATGPAFAHLILGRVSQKATAFAMQGCIAIFDGCKPLKMAESENRTFPIPSRKSPGKGFYDILLR
ncbi:hypothetical protein, partial [Thiolapillus sp.]